MTVRRERVPALRLALFTRQLAVMVDAGLPLVQSLDILGRQERHPMLARSILKVRREVEGGSSLAAAMRTQPRTFDALYTNLVAAGETGGVLDAVLKRLAGHIEKTVRLKRDVTSALVYPATVVAAAAIVVGLILWKVVPAFSTLFEGLGAELPLPTRTVIGASDLVVRHGWVGLAAAAAGVVAVRRYRTTVPGRLASDRMLLRAPLVGPLLRHVAVSRIARTLSTLLGAGVPIVQALDIAARTAGNAAMERAVVSTRIGIERGKPLSVPLRAAAVFPPLVVQMVQVGETTGSLDAMLARLADFYEEEVDRAVRQLLTLLEPVLIVVLGAVVGGIVISMYLPIFDLVHRV